MSPHFARSSTVPTEPQSRDESRWPNHLTRDTYRRLRTADLFGYALSGSASRQIGAPVPAHWGRARCPPIAGSETCRRSSAICAGHCPGNQRQYSGARTVHRGVRCRAGSGDASDGASLDVAVRVARRSEPERRVLELMARDSPTPASPPDPSSSHHGATERHRLFTAATGGAGGSIRAKLAGRQPPAGGHSGRRPGRSARSGSPPPLPVCRTKTAAPAASGNVGVGVCANRAFGAAHLPESESWATPKTTSSSQFWLPRT